MNKKELQTQSFQNAFSEINLVNTERLISTKEKVIDTLQHHIEFLGSFHQTPQQIATTNAADQNVKHNSLVLNKSSNRNSKKSMLCFSKK